METFTFLNLLLMTTGAASYVCKHLGWQCKSLNYPYRALVIHRWMEDVPTFVELDSTCSGTLIHEQWVLTHADCYFDPASRIPLEVKFGSCSEGLCDKIQIIPHDNIMKFSNSSDALDVMLLKLPETMSDITPAQLPPLPCKRPGIGSTLLALYGRRLHCVDRNVTACYDKREERSGMLFCAKAIGSVSPFISCPVRHGHQDFSPVDTVVLENNTAVPSYYSCWTFGLLGGEDDIGGPLLSREGGSDFVYGVKAFGSEFLDVCSTPIRQWINDSINGP